MPANPGTQYTYSSRVTNNEALDGTFKWTTPNPPIPGRFDGKYTLTSNSSNPLTMTHVDVNGEHVTFKITVSGQRYTFSGNFNNGNNNFHGHVGPSSPGDPDDWTASAQ
jgi:hypothetical protein